MAVLRQFSVDGVGIKAPTSYKPVFATTSTEDSDRTQDLIMHNTPMGTIAGYDMQWDQLTTEEAQTILKGMMNKSSFSFYHHDVLTGWVSKDFYASNFSVQAVRLKDGQELWTGLAINIRAINPIVGVMS